MDIFCGCVVGHCFYTWYLLVKIVVILGFHNFIKFTWVMIYQLVNCSIAYLHEALKNLSTRRLKIYCIPISCGLYSSLLLWNIFVMHHFWKINKSWPTRISNARYWLKYIVIHLPHIFQFIAIAYEHFMTQVQICTTSNQMRRWYPISLPFTTWTHKTH